VRLDWTPTAITHLRAAYEYVAGDNAAAAEALLDKIFSAVERLQQYPQMGRRGRVDGTRELVIPGTKFVTVYSSGRESVEMLAVFHAARRWPGEF
jgi:plasmid stabilization system protein ParE